MSQFTFKNPTSLLALATTVFLATASTSPAWAAPDAISTRPNQRPAQPTTAGVSATSQITRSKNVKSVQALARAKSLPVSTRPEKKKGASPARAQTTHSVAMPVRVSITTYSTAKPETTSAVPLEATVATTKIADKAPIAPTAALTSEQKAADAKAKADRALLAKLEADLGQTQTRLDTTSQKLSAGQRQLMSFSNTLENAIIEAGDDGAGLHPFVRVASRYAGTPYVWGGESRYGFDCSGFIIRVMRDLGYKALPHSAAEQFKYGKPVAQGLLKPGDIVFFANTYKPGISHVGIYIGKRRFIHAASTRQGTIVSSLDASPYRQKYAGARRLLTVRKKS